MLIEHLALQCHKISVEHGWWDGTTKTLTPSQIAEKLLMIHAEISEAAEEIRGGPENYEMYFENGKPEGLAVELVDALFRILDLSERMDLNLSGAIGAKLEYNKSRSHRHGGKAL